ncbi:MAG: type VI secretion system lipoprotein TssJ [Thermodesulfobacteriota bacterium]|nr:type VI secretion system lipoprotein TssJ [Thermodesulfobacteriota bacterium]
MSRIKIFYIFLLPALLILLLSSCAAKKKPDTADPSLVWGFGKKAIEISYKADKNLNLYDEKPHTILMCLYQLSDPNIFNELSKSEDGLNKLLKCSRFDQSVAGFMRIIVQPGENKNLSLDRAEKAKWVGIVAGYYNLSPDMVTRLFEIPVVTERKWLLLKKPIPGNLSVDLSLGSNKINQSGSK